MTFPETTPAGYLSPWDQQRKFSVKSVSNETIPGFALMYIDPSRGGWFWSTEEERGRIVFLVDKPNALCEWLQDPSLLIANGPIPIPPYGSGWGTQDWPAQVLHDGIHDGLPNALTAGPKEDSWYAWSSFSAFTCLSHDATWAVRRPAGSALPQGIHTVWLSPNTTSAGTRYTGSRGGGTVSAGQPFPRPGIQIADALGVFGDPGDAGGLTSGVSATDTFEFLAGGIYWIAVAGTLSSPDAAEGDSLTLTVATRPAGSSTFTYSYLSGYRLQCVEDDAYTGQAAFYTAENVSFQGPLEVVKGEQLQLINESQSSMAAGNLILSVFRLVPAVAPPPGVGGGSGGGG